MMSTATPLTRASAGSGPKTSQAATVSSASASTAGTNQRVTRSTTAWMGSLDACAAFHRADDAGEQRVGADARHAHGERAGAVHRAADHGGAGGLAHGHGLAGDHGFVDVALAFGHLAVGGQALAGADLHHVAGAEFGDRHLGHGAAAAADAGGARLQLDQAADGVGGAVPRARFQDAAEQHQGDDHRGGLEVDVGAPRRQQAGRDGGDGRNRPRRPPCRARRGSSCRARRGTAPAGRGGRSGAPARTARRRRGRIARGARPLRRPSARAGRGRRGRGARPCRAAATAAVRRAASRRARASSARSAFRRSALVSAASVPPARPNGLARGSRPPRRRRRGRRARRRRAGGARSARSVARLTLASSTPGTARRARSIAAHAGGAVHPFEGQFRRLAATA